MCGERAGAVGWGIFFFLPRNFDTLWRHRAWGLVESQGGKEGGREGGRLLRAELVGGLPGGGG